MSVEAFMEKVETSRSKLIQFVSLVNGVLQFHYWRQVMAYTTLVVDIRGCRISKVSKLIKVCPFTRSPHHVLCAICLVTLQPLAKKEEYLDFVNLYSLGTPGSSLHSIQATSGRFAFMALPLQQAPVIYAM